MGLSGDLRPIVSQTGTDREPPESARALHANSGMVRHVVVLGATGSMTANTGRVIGALRVVAGPGYPRRGAHCRQEPGAVRVAAHRGLRRLAATVDRAGVTP